MSTDIKYPYYNPELWGGIECTINRVNNNYRDQLRDTNHYDRIGDIERIASLNIRKLRYPLLWERYQPTPNQVINWKSASDKIEKIYSHNIEPIVGLLHHGSGPRYTDLLDPEFANKFSAYATLVAEQFPQLTYYTPVNEPLTTARFSGLYGFWYPHQCNEKAFFEMLLNQVKAIVLSMQAIRRVNPFAKLVQTEDLGKTHSTYLLRYQEMFENERRWLTYDLLCGKVDSQHYFWKYLLALGIPEKKLRFFTDNVCRPEIVGFNYYITSERFLDDNLFRHPGVQIGGNGKHSYVDTEAVRTDLFTGLPGLMKEAWQRYKLPMAITECHLNCTREEQMRWLKETWDTCCQMKKKGMDIRAVTAWALLGSFDWDSLLTIKNNRYEGGAFVLNGNNLRPTALSKVIRSLATDGSFEHPLVESPGWWHRSSEVTDKSIKSKKGKPTAPLLIVGSTGTLGTAFCRICDQRRIGFRGLTRSDMNLVDTKSIKDAIDLHKPWGIINAAGYVRVDEAEYNREACFDLNTKGPGALAKICQNKGIRFMSFSSDMVFDGNKLSPYNEVDRVSPLNVYGESKAEAEKEITSANPDALIIRSSAFFGPWDKYNFAHLLIEALQASRNFIVPADVIVSPTYVPDLVNAALDLFIDEENGIWHLSNEGSITWSDFAIELAERGSYKKSLIEARPLKEMGWKALRPIYSVLQSDKGIKLPALTKAIDRYFSEKIV